MGCINCKSLEEQNAMKDRIKQLAEQGFDINRIAAMLMIQKSFVEETLAPSASEEVIMTTTPKKKTKK